MRQALIEAKVAVEGKLRVFYAETCISEGGYISDLSDEERADLHALSAEQDAIDEQLDDDEYAAAYDICAAKFPDFL